jgi:polysaccharide pyruvyl transferase WcaK-like protein
LEERYTEFAWPVKGIRVDKAEQNKRGAGTKIAFLGNFGQKNLGNEATLRAIVENIGARAPDAELICICTDPVVAASIHGIATLSIHALFADPKFLQQNVITRLIRKLTIGIPNEVRRWLLALRALQRVDMLIVPGTQFLSDNISGPWGWPYWTFRWCIAAKLRRSKVLFVSVGVGPLRHWVSRSFVKFALRLADFRSYRDQTSKQFLSGIAFERPADPVYPDLVFSLPRAAFGKRGQKKRTRPTIAVGVKDYHGQYEKARADLPPERIYQRYIAQLTHFLEWLLRSDYTVRLVIGDVTYDTQVLHDLRLSLTELQLNYDNDGRLISEPIESLEDLLEQLATCDLVISPRFHNIVLAHMLGLPAIAISYHEKFAALLESSRLSNLNVAIDNADPETIIAKFRELESYQDELRAQIADNVARYRAALDEQYDRILELLPSR